MRLPYDLHGDEPSLDEILEEVASWDGSKPPAGEASSPFVALVSPAQPPAPAGGNPPPLTAEQADTAPQSAGPASAETTSPPQRETLTPEEEAPWIATWENLRVEEVWGELRPGAGLPPRPSPGDRATEPEEGREFGHLTLLPPVPPPVGTPDTEAVPPQEQAEAQNPPPEEETQTAAPPDGAKAEPESEPGTRGEGESAEQADMPEGTGENPPPKAEAAAAPEEGRDNLVPFVSTKEPETIREALGHLSQKAKVWLRLRKDKVAEPIVKLPRPKLRLRELPELPVDETLSIKELARAHNAGLGRLRLQALGSLLLALLLLLAAVIGNVDLFAFLTPLREGALLGRISLGIFALLALLVYPLYPLAIKGLIRLQPGMELLGLLAALAVLTDAVLLLFYQYRPYTLPLFAPVALVLSFQMMGSYWTKNALRLCCRTAARSRDPDLLCKEEKQYNGKAVYRRRRGESAQFAAAVQREDWAKKSFRYLVPLLLLLAVSASVWASVGSGQGRLLFWSLSATLSAAATLSGCLCFGLPFHGLSLRLSKLGAALCGWSGAKNSEQGHYILLCDTDLFPPGSIELSSFLTYHEYDSETVVSVTASLLREAGSGLDVLFHNLIRMDEGRYVTVSDLELHSDGISGEAMGKQVLIGNANCLERMGVALPPGVRMAMGVMTAIDGRFAGRFVLDYSMHKTSVSDMDALLLNRITPVLTAVDFNLLPQVLRRLFRFPWDKISFPELGQRKKMADAPAYEGSALLGLLTMEGLSGLSTMIVGAKRLRKAVKSCTRFTYLGALLGIFLCTYLSMAAALTALNALSLSLFLLLWFVPVAMISGWVNQF